MLIIEQTVVGQGARGCMGTVYSVEFFYKLKAALKLNPINVNKQIN